jgi:hypothetical protein
MTQLDDQTTAQTRVLEALELAQRTAPFCGRCGQPTRPVARGASLWLECPTLQGERSLVRRLFDADLGIGHTRRAILDDAAEDETLSVTPAIAEHVLAEG